MARSHTKSWEADLRVLPQTFAPGRLESHLGTSFQDTSPLPALNPGLINPG